MLKGYGFPLNENVAPREVLNTHNQSEFMWPSWSKRDIEHSSLAGESTLAARWPGWWWCVHLHLLYNAEPRARYFYHVQRANWVLKEVVYPAQLSETMFLNLQGHKSRYHSPHPVRSRGRRKESEIRVVVIPWCLVFGKARGSNTHTVVFEVRSRLTFRGNVRLFGKGVTWCHHMGDLHNMFGLHNMCDLNKGRNFIKDNIRTPHQLSKAGACQPPNE